MRRFKTCIICFMFSGDLVLLCYEKKYWIEFRHFIAKSVANEATTKTTLFGVQVSPSDTEHLRPCFLAYSNILF
jgi:hypothetical protein